MPQLSLPLWKSKWMKMLSYCQLISTFSFIMLKVDYSDIDVVVTSVNMNTKKTHLRPLKKTPLR